MLRDLLRPGGLWEGLLPRGLQDAPRGQQVAPLHTALRVQPLRGLLMSGRIKLTVRSVVFSICCTHDNFGIVAGQPAGGVLQGVLPPARLPAGGAGPPRSAQLLQGVPGPGAGSRRRGRGPGPRGPEAAAGPGRGPHGAGYPGLRRLQVEGRLPRERGHLAPNRTALGGDEVHLLHLQGGGV